MIRQLLAVSTGKGFFMLASMTGFSRLSKETEWGMLVWEVRSVNHRFLEMSTRLPESFRQFDIDVRSAVKKRLKRGKLDVSLSFIPSLSQDCFEIDESAFSALCALYARVSAAFPNVSTNPSDVLKAEGVVKRASFDADVIAPDLFEALEQALDQLIERRQQEGVALQGYLVQAVEGIRNEVAVVSAHLPQVLAEERARIAARAKEFEVALDDARLEQEMVYLAQKSDIAEELQRLTVHVDEISRVLENGGVVGRRLDFVIQELNREANTIASKSLSVETTQASVEMKVLIEQMREQVQNIE